MKKLIITVLIFAAFRVMAVEIKKDFSTPEGAILMLEEAYQKKDLEAAVAAKDFMIEARVMLVEKGMDLEKNKELLKKTAEVLELSFRYYIKKDGFPDFTGLKSTFEEKKPYKDFKDVWIITEVCTYPDGGISKQKLLIATTEQGWRVLNPTK